MTVLLRAASGRVNSDMQKWVNIGCKSTACLQTLWRITSRKLDQLDSVQQLEELRVPSVNRLEKLSGDRKAEHSIRINEQYRIGFIWGELGGIFIGHS